MVMMIKKMTFIIHYLSKLSLTFFRLSVVSGNKTTTYFGITKFLIKILKGLNFKKIFTIFNFINTKLYRTQEAKYVKYFNLSVIIFPS